MPRQPPPPDASRHTTRDFFAGLTRRRFATAYPCWPGGGHFYHLHHKGLYRAVGNRITGIGAA